MFQMKVDSAADIERQAVCTVVGAARGRKDAMQAVGISGKNLRSCRPGLWSASALVNTKINARWVDDLRAGAHRPGDAHHHDEISAGSTGLSAVG